MQGWKVTDREKLCLLVETRILGENPIAYFSLILAILRKKYFAIFGKNSFFADFEKRYSDFFP